MIELVISSTAQGVFICENCGAFAGTSWGWPAGWVRTGRSRRRALIYSPTPSVTACWCPQCQAFKDEYVRTNPSEADVLELVIPHMGTWGEVQIAMRTLSHMRTVQVYVS